MATVLEIIQGLSQVMANSYDGAVDEEGNRKETGLKRDEEVAIKDKRVIDGFKVKLHSANKLCIMYTTQVLAKDILESKGKYQDALLQDVADVASFIKKEFKKVTGKTLSLKELKDPKPDFEVIQTSRVRTEVKVFCHYEIDSIEDTFSEKDSYREKMLKAAEKWLSQSSDKKSENDTRKQEKKDK